MNEIRDLIIGIDFGKDYSQICYYDRKGEEPCSVSMKVGAQEFEAPTCICRRGEHKEYTIGLEAVYFAREKGGQMVDDLYGICKKEDSVQILGEQVEPWELLQVFLEGMLKFLGVADLVKNTKCLVITSPELEDPQVKNMEKACQAIGFSKNQYMLIDHGESFYYYSLTQKRETWNRSIGWYSFHQDEVKFQQLTMDSSTRPVLVRLEEPKKTVLPSLTAPEEEGEKAVEARDEAFRDFIKETLGTGLFSSIQITGYGFSPDWAKMSIGSLCMQRRKVYYGNNLFAKGACAAGKERLEDKILKGYRYMSPALVLKDVGMEMRVMGAPAYYPLIEAATKEIGRIEKEIDDKEHNIEALCMQLLLKQQPVGTDLRKISAALKMVTDMERIGDQATDIAEILNTGSVHVPVTAIPLQEMADYAMHMVNDSVTAYVEEKSDLAKKVISSDNVLDNLFDKVRNALDQNTMDFSSDEVLDLLMISKYYERIGDHATNIGEWAEFSVDGIHRNGDSISDLFNPDSL